MRECLFHLIEIRGVVLRDVRHLLRDGGVRGDAAIDALLVGEVQALLIIAQRVPLVLGVLDHEVHRDGGILGPRGVELLHDRLDLGRRPVRPRPFHVPGRVRGVVAAGGVDGIRGDRDCDCEQPRRDARGRAVHEDAHRTPRTTIPTMGRRVDAFCAHVSLNRACLSRTRTRSRRLTFGIVYNEKDATCQAHYSTVRARKTFVRVNLSAGDERGFFPWHFYNSRLSSAKL